MYNNLHTIAFGFSDSTVITELLQSKGNSIKVENCYAMADELSLNYNPVILLFHENSSIRLNRLPSWIFRRIEILSALLPLSRRSRTGLFRNRLVAWPYTESNQPQTETYQEHPTILAGQWRIPDCNSSQSYSSLHRTVSMHWRLRMAYTLHQRNFLSDLISLQEW